VDDDDDIRDLIASHLDRAGYRHVGAATLAEARAALARHDIALMLLDLTLPDGDGMTFCRDLRAEGFVVAIIMLTARSTPGDRVEGLEGGADDYLSKPFDARELIIRMRNVLKRGIQARNPSPAVMPALARGVSIWRSAA
jgi:two-component system OmpR family response regulator